MKLLSAVFAALFFNSVLRGTMAKEECKHLLHRLAASQQDYVRCSTSNAVPVKLCMGCENDYFKMQEAYGNLTKSQNCSKEYFDHDRLNVVQTTQNMLLGLWKKAYCDYCINSNNSETFEEKLQELNLCFKLHDDKTKCAACILQYLDLNNFYVSLDQHNNGQVCYDLQDSMNQTRVYWSKELNCCRREFRMTMFLVVTICIGSLPIVFYVSAYILTRRRERYHSVLNIAENLDDNRQTAIPTAVHQTPISTEQPHKTAILKDNTHQQIDEETDDDDDDIPIMQKIT